MNKISAQQPLSTLTFLSVFYTLILMSLGWTIYSQILKAILALGCLSFAACLVIYYMLHFCAVFTSSFKDFLKEYAYLLGVLIQAGYLTLTLSWIPLRLALIGGLLYGLIEVFIFEHTRALVGEKFSWMTIIAENILLLSMLAYAALMSNYIFLSVAFVITVGHFFASFLFDDPNHNGNQSLVLGVLLMGQQYAPQIFNPPLQEVDNLFYPGYSFESMMHNICIIAVFFGSYKFFISLYRGSDSKS